MSEKEYIKNNDSSTNLKIQEYGIFRLLAAPFVIYFRNFFKMFTIAVIPEFLIFGIFYLVLIDIEYDLTLNKFTSFGLDFRNEYVTGWLIPLIIFAVLLLILRSSIITNIAWKAVEKPKVNVFWAIDVTFRKIKQIFLASIILIGFLAVPGLLFIFAILFSYRIPFVSWFLIAISVGIPLLLGSKLSLFNVAVNKDDQTVGRAFQHSWELTRRANWIKTVLVVGIFATISIILPWIFTNVFIGMVGDWMGYIMIIVRALLYPLFDTALTMTYIHNDLEILQNATFKEDIIKQRERSNQMFNQ